MRSELICPNCKGEFTGKNPFLCAQCCKEQYESVIERAMREVKKPEKKKAKTPVQKNSKKYKYDSSGQDFY